MSQLTQQAVTLSDLLAQPLKTDLSQLCTASDSRPVRGVVLISDIDEITSIEPDTVIVLSADVARGSWMVSAALRYAWERNAAALIVPERLLNPSVVQLAERFHISLFTTSANVTVAAIEVATALGFARAQLVSTLHQLTSQVEASEDVSEVLGLASAWLQGARVHLESSGAVVRSATAPSSERKRGMPTTGLMNRVSVPVGSGRARAGQLVTEVPSSMRNHAAAVLEICTTRLRALLAEAQLDAFQQSLPPLSLAALTGSDSALPAPPSDHAWLTWPTWPAGTEFVALCMLSEHSERHGAALHHVWLADFRDCPLVRTADGWLAALPLIGADAGADADRVLARTKARLAEIHLLDIRIGVSRTHTGQAEFRRAAQEAWLAARVASVGGQHDVVSYDAIPGSLLSRLLPASFAEETLAMRYPALAADPHREELIRMHTQYAANLGSATATATSLGIHRNTVKQRLERLEELGVPVRDADEALGLHLLFAAVSR